ncbi:SulP family inorganic anion transporter [Pseudarthrobacter sp. Y6]|uniref:SulP family inorganic anion transporter n=1 Tax=Pseudarthrobacter sp. Y6 TaxID=3418422 RepID=UPI003CEF18DD
MPLHPSLRSPPSIRPLNCRWWALCRRDCRPRPWAASAWTTLWRLSRRPQKIAPIAFADTSTLSKSLAGSRGQKVSGEQEMAALGVANVASGMLGGFPCAGVHRVLDAGARTQLSGVVAALLVLPLWWPHRG